MFSTNPRNKLAILAISSVLFTAIGIPGGAEPPELSRPIALDARTDGTYQFCSQPNPGGDYDGAGVCFTFAQVGDRIDGYYGYPHSGDFVCIRGRRDKTQIVGTALAVSWPGHAWSNVPPLGQWKLDDHLTLGNGYVVRSVNDETGPVAWIQFDEATLDTDGFYQYSNVTMTPPAQLCEWDEVSSVPSGTPFQHLSESSETNPSPHDHE